MKTKMKRALSMFLALTMCAGLAVTGAVAADDENTDQSGDIYETVTYDVGRVDARSALDEINAEREDGELPDFVYDYDLEEIALQLAAEQAIVTGQTRPNGSGWDTAMDDYPYDTAYEAVSYVSAFYNDDNEKVVGISDIAESVIKTFGSTLYDEDMTNIAVGCACVDNICYIAAVISSVKGATNTTNAPEIDCDPVTAEVKNGITSIRVFNDAGSLKNMAVSVDCTDERTVEAPVVSVTFTHVSSSFPALSATVAPAWETSDRSVAYAEDGLIVLSHTGTTDFTASVFGVDCVFTLTAEVIHQWENPTVEWSDDYAKCTAVFICTACGEEETVDAEVTLSETVEPTCAESGRNIYQAVFTFEGRQYIRYGLEVLPPTGDHIFDWDDPTEVKEATCTEAGYMIFTCTVCGEATYTVDLPALGHLYDAEPEFIWSGHSCTARFTCTREGCGHTLDRACTVTQHTTVNPGCTTHGVDTYTAAVTYDGQTYRGYMTEETNPVGHNYSRTVIVDPTCTAGGYTEHICSRCGASYQDSYTSARGHQWNSGIVTKQPTATETGIRTFTCTVCGATMTETIPATGETTATTTTTVETTQADNRNAGNATTETATNENTNKNTETKTETEHTWDNGVVTKAATCTNDGIMTYTCKTCGATRTETIPATGHKWGEYTFEWDDNYHCTAYVKCTVCGETETTPCTVTSEQRMNSTEWYTLYTAEADGHTAEAKVNHRMAEPEFIWNDDYTECSAVFTCSDCGLQGRAACTVNYDMDEPTCEKDGAQVYSANIFEWTDIHREPIDALGHLFTSASFEWNDNNSECIATMVCDRCGEEFEQECEVTIEEGENGATVYRAEVEGTELYETKTVSKDGTETVVEDGTYNEEGGEEGVITVEESEPNDNHTVLIICIVAGVVIVAAIVAYLIYRHNYNKKTNGDNPDNGEDVDASEDDNDEDDDGE